MHRFAITMLALFALAVPAAAQSYPERVVRIVNPYPPGGSVDVMARILAQKLTENLGQQFIVENRSGGGGNTGAESVAKSEPDGYTLLFTAPGPLTINQTLYGKLAFDPLVLDLNGDGLETIGLSDSKVHFDSLHNLFAARTGWLSGNDGFLVLDKNRNGLIDDGSEMFGSDTLGGFADLAQYDSNQAPVFNFKLSLSGRMLVIKQGSGATYRVVNTTNWHVSTR